MPTVSRCIILKNWAFSYGAENKNNARAVNKVDSFIFYEGNTFVIEGNELTLHDVPVILTDEEMTFFWTFENDRFSVEAAEGSPAETEEAPEVDDAPADDAEVSADVDVQADEPGDVQADAPADDEPVDVQADAPADEPEPEASTTATIVVDKTVPKLKLPTSKRRSRAKKGDSTKS